MYIRRLGVDNFGSIAHFEKALSSRPAIIKSSDPKAVIAGIGLLLESKRPYSVPPASLAGQNTRLYAEIETNSGVFYVEKLYDRNHFLTAKITHQGGVGDVYGYYRAFMYRSAEEDSVCFFNASQKQPVASRLFRYANEDKFYAPGEFGALTDGMGSTKTFRSLLKGYIGEDALLPEIGLEPCAAEKKVYQFLGFLDTARFWDKFCKIRDLHYEGKPLLVANFSAEPKKTLPPRLNMDRQILFFSDANSTK